jgi:hypothetical protein
MEQGVGEKTNMTIATMVTLILKVFHIRELDIDHNKLRKEPIVDLVLIREDITIIICKSSFL